MLEKSLEECLNNASKITPVPGGVGAVARSSGAGRGGGAPGQRGAAAAAARQQRRGAAAGVRGAGAQPQPHLPQHRGARVLPAAQALPPQPQDHRAPAPRQPGRPPAARGRRHQGNELRRWHAAGGGAGRIGELVFA